ncbi:substrate-binding periplasmic protein [Undibacterium oligocarboniphilum]|uniref:Transporter substrate-binding domain-containing protein n=1 Tax=Undibacterium oligocarboniphilum TaxID=666702 RepID=A0A850QF21_9BURK|nr:transporter substrate-binding domain-containing protein [Undibacterium oligocarboniphilum]MBC3871569.1 transporter substrate-binding domain-containing protein [Undibacterium oligocarboniphilum]NVO79072.1 transporter substrate-binding domain-containing protein [Undibacterium oligocarboniphilum]
MLYLPPFLLRLPVSCRSVLNAILLLGSFSTGMSSHAAGTGNPLSASITLMISESRDENGVLIPIRPENQAVIHYFEKALNISFQLRRLPLPRITAELQEGENLAFGLSKNSERQKFMQFSEPVFTDIVWIVVREDSKMEFNNLQDLQGKSVGIVRGVRFGDEIERQRNLLFRVEEDTSQLSSRLKKLLSGRMDCFLFNSRTTFAAEVEAELNQYLVNVNMSEINSKPLRIRVLSKPLIADEIHFAAGLRNHEHLLKSINAAIIKGRKSGELPPLLKH